MDEIPSTLDGYPRLIWQGGEAGYRFLALGALARLAPGRVCLLLLDDYGMEEG